VHCVCLRRDYYDVLSVSKGASDSQLKRAYRKLALKYHPVSVQHCCARRAAEGGTSIAYACTLARDEVLMRSDVSQDKVKGDDREAASKKFAEINHGVRFVLHAVLLPVTAVVICSLHLIDVVMGLQPTRCYLMRRSGAYTTAMARRA
jgi:DnaJ domain